MKNTALPVVDGRPQLGAHAHSLEMCTYCPKLCRPACPVSNAEPRETFIPQAKMQTLNFLRRGHLPWEPAYVEPLYACTGCGHCKVYCAHGINVAAALFDGRAVAVEHGLGHPALARSVEQYPRRGEALAAATRALVPAARLATEAKVGFLPGCDDLDAPGGVGGSLAALAVLDRLSMEHVRVPILRHPCGGEPLRAAGALDALERHDAMLAEDLRGFDTVLLGCAPCARRLRERSRAGLLRPEILHIVEYLGPHAERLPVARRLPPVFYQDPCHLGRGMGVYDPPRRLLAATSESLKELAWAREDAFCCGGGGGVPETLPDVSFAMARARLQEVIQGGGEVLATACSTCRRTLRAASARLGGGVRVADVTELLEEATRGD